ncbi:MAG TPA: tyrosine--tRNA ligase [Candidatus Paceibacterota bacterium]
MKDTKVNKDHTEAYIDGLLTRSIQSIYPSKEALKRLLISGRKLRIYIGADATGPDLHLGHSTNYILLEKFRKLGHEVIVLFGDFTAMIGDPSDKSATRVPLTSKNVNENISTWKKQLKPLVNFSAWKNPAKIFKNSKWLSKMSFSNVLGLASNFTVQQIIERDMFQERVKAEKPIYLHEFLYPMMQGYDSVAMDVDIEIGGNDQTFNMLAGRQLQKKFRNKEKFVIATTLLTNPKTGKKLMSKSEGDYVSLEDSAEEMFGKIMALPDQAILQMLTDCTFLSLEKIEEIRISLASGANPRDAKIVLAKEIVSIYHGQYSAEKAEKNFANTFNKKEIPEDLKELQIKKGDTLSLTLLRGGVISSKGEFFRLVGEGAVTELQTAQKITDTKYIAKPGVYKIGKHRFVKLIANSFKLKNYLYEWIFPKTINHKP